MFKFYKFKHLPLTENEITELDELPIFGETAASKAIKKIAKESDTLESKLRAIVKSYLVKDPVLAKKF